MSSFSLDQPAPERADPMVALIVAAITAMTESQQRELAQRLAQKDKEDGK
jgi:hypothetical protein